MRTILFACAVLAVAACDPYDPNLGERPFRCDEEEPRCPKGYVCVEHSESEELCERENAAPTPDAGDDTSDSGGGQLTCNDDSLIEPNDEPDDATPTPIPSGGADRYELVRLAICPDSDKDLFRFGVAEQGKNVTVEVTHKANRGELLLDVLNGTGVSIKQGNPTSDADVIRAEVDNLATGTYYAQVRAPAGVENNYSIEIVTTGP